MSATPATALKLVLAQAGSPGRGEWLLVDADRAPGELRSIPFPAPRTPAALGKLTATVLDLAAHVDVAVGLAARTDTGAIARSRFAWAELDGGDGRLGSFSPAPTFVLRRGERLTALWALRTPLARLPLEATLGLLADRLDGARAACRADHRLTVPFEIVRADVTLHDLATLAGPEGARQ